MRSARQPGSVLAGGGRARGPWPWAGGPLVLRGCGPWASVSGNRAAPSWRAPHLRRSAILSGWNGQGARSKPALGGLPRGQAEEWDPRARAVAVLDV